MIELFVTGYASIKLLLYLMPVDKPMKNTC